jgi:hypothetical protein
VRHPVDLSARCFRAPCCNRRQISIPQCARAPDKPHSPAVARFTHSRCLLPVASRRILRQGLAHQLSRSTFEIRVHRSARLSNPHVTDLRRYARFGHRSSPVYAFRLRFRRPRRFLSTRSPDLDFSLDLASNVKCRVLTHVRSPSTRPGVAQSLCLVCIALPRLHVAEPGSSSRSSRLQRTKNEGFLGLSQVPQGQPFTIMSRRVWVNQRIRGNERVPY